MKNYRKFVVAGLSAAVTASSLGLLSDPWDKWTAVVAAGLGALGVYAVKNGE